MDNLNGLFVGALETVRNGSGVDTLSHQVLAGSEESTSHNDNGSSTITSLNILSLGDFDKLKRTNKKVREYSRIKSDSTVRNYATYHSSGGVNNLHLGEDSGSIVGNDNLTLGVLDLYKNNRVSIFKSK